VGLSARNIPLVIPRVHDCIALFLGSDKAYREQFQKFPGTYYISAGWVAEKAQPQGINRAHPESDPEYQRLVKEHGQENADEIRYFLASWQRNYQRAAFIDTGAAGKKANLADIAKQMAHEFGWRYEEIPGSRDLLRKLLTQRATDADILIVPPHHITTYDAVSRGLQAVPVWMKGRVSGHERERVILRGLPDGEPPRENRASAASSRVGLGIDAGGTYTDVAIYDFESDRVLHKAKALTTKWDYTIGIENALKQLPVDCLEKIDLVAMSTTLATNAIVEDRGQLVGLLIMPPYGLFDDKDIEHRPIAIIRGKMDIDGTIMEPVDAGQVRQIVREMLQKERVGAFAVCGYASHVNPAQELEVKAIVREACGLSVTCGHDVSEGVNYRVRAATAALNGRIIPQLEALIDHTRATLAGRRIHAPLMVVRSDGTLMSASTARERPIETILSGPAASVAGARHLSKLRDALVTDMGGTTTDTALIRDGLVRTCAEGARVGGHLTHVKALDMRTLGLGGDSRIAYENRSLQIGPRRVAPICWLAARSENWARAFDWIERRVDHFDTSTGGMDILVLNAEAESPSLNEREKRILAELAHGPMCLDELAVRTDTLAWEWLPVAHLEEHHLVQRCGLTPTDVLHATGELRLWDAAAAERACAVYSRLSGQQRAKFQDSVLQLVVHKLAVELLKMQLADTTDPDAMESSPVALALVNNMLKGGEREYDVKVRLHRPVVGIGAPVHFFLPEAARLLGTEAVVPPNADVANAIGAVTSQVCVHQCVEIFCNDTGRYAISGIQGAPTFADLEDATQLAMDKLRRTLLRQAWQSGTDETTVEITLDDRSATLADGAAFFVKRRIEARLTGRPNLGLLGATR